MRRLKRGSQRRFCAKKSAVNSFFTWQSVLQRFLQKDSADKLLRHLGIPACLFSMVLSPSSVLSSVLKKSLGSSTDDLTEFLTEDKFT